MVVGPMTHLSGYEPSAIDETDETDTSFALPRVHRLPGKSIQLNQSLIQQLPSSFEKAKISLLVEKSAYRLTVYYAGQPVKSYPVVFGPEPVKDKRYEGDGATPEGIFYIRNLYPHQRWSKFLWVDYPTADSWQKHNTDKETGRIPVTSTIGGEIGIHGVPNHNNQLIADRTNWTAGCVSLTNPDIDELYSVSSRGMLVEIVP